MEGDVKLASEEDIGIGKDIDLSGRLDGAVESVVGPNRSGGIEDNYAATI